MEIITENVISNAVYYEDVNPENILIHIRSRPMGRCSSTGDPHYTTFDGYSYHFYDRGEVLMVRSFSRDFEVQARTHGGPYSRNCAVAARENNNLAIIDVCDGSLEITTRSLSEETAPRIYRSGSNQYFIDFVSGSQIQAHIWGNNMNIYISVISADYGNTIGMCGTFDGNRNNEGNPAYVIRPFSQLPDYWKINSETSLWNWYPEPSDDSETNNSGEETCEYTRPLQRRPILRYPNVEDITDLIRESSQRINSDEFIRNYSFIPRGEHIIPEETVSEEEAISICTNKIHESDEGIECQNQYGINLDSYFNNCVEDILQMQDKIFVNDAFQI